MPTEATLFDQFPPVSTEAWKAVIEKDLDGADYEKKLVKTTEEGIKIKPVYRKEDLPDSEWIRRSQAGAWPFLRGYSAAGNDWIVRQEILNPAIAEANDLARRSLERGAEEVSFISYPRGVRVMNQDEMKTLLGGINLESTSLVFQAGPVSPQMYAMYVNEAERQGADLSKLSGTAGFDPITDGATGYLDRGLALWQTEARPMVEFAAKHTPMFRSLTVQASRYSAAGASCSHQLAIALAILTEYLAFGGDPGLASRIEVRFGIGTDYFMEIAKLRAARVTIAKVLEGFGIAEGRPHIHAVTSISDKTLYDPHVNMLRGTTEAMAAAIGGADSIAVHGFDQAFRIPDAFSERIARNTQLLLREESYLGKVADPLGGSYFIEWLTHEIAERAWKGFQEIEAAGGFVAAWSKGLIQSDIQKAREAKKVAAERKIAPIVGVSNYPNLKERRLDDVQDLADFGPVRPAFDDCDDLPSLQGLLAGGKSVEEWATGQPKHATDLDPFRPSEPFEKLRLRVEKHVAKGGKAPTVFLAMLGDRTWRRARAGFCAGFYGVGGFAVLEDTFETPESAAQRAKQAGADVVVLCSSDAEYLDLTNPTKKAMLGLGLDVPLVIAGFPADSIDALKEAGADDFVHVKSPLIQTLSDLLGKVGVA